MDVQTIQRMVHGSLSLNVCQLLSDLIEELPDSGSVLDLYCGAGLSTVLLASSMDYYGKNSATILSVDTHISNPLSDTPHVDGTILTHLKNLRSFRVLNRVTTVIATTGMIGKLLNKKSVNLVVMQVPDMDSMLYDIQLSQEVIRNGGKIVVCHAAPTPNAEFPERVNRCFLSKDFTCVIDMPDAQVYQCMVKKNGGST